ncbi:MAG: hypothetical protein WCJ55_05235 [Chloroflexales bacterium]
MPTYLHGALSAHLPPLRLVSRGAQEYAGACPFCGGDERRSDRFHVWLLPAGRERYWCRRCNRKGLASELTGVTQPCRPCQDAELRRSRVDGPAPRLEHIPHYRALYAIVTAWAEENLHQPWNPEPLAYLRQRGFDLATIRWARLGYALRDPVPLATYLARHAPRLLPFAEEAGVLVRTDDGALRAHWNLCGRIVIPYLSQGQVCDLRTRRFPGTGYTSLPGSYAWRGATVPICWDTTAASDIVLITEGEFKALAATAAYRADALPYPTIAHPGLNYFRPEWAMQLVQRGVRVAILAYDTRATRPRDPAGHEQLAPEECWTVRHGLTLAAAGLQVLVLNLPLAHGAEKEDLDGFLLRHGSAALRALLHTTPLPLPAFVARLPQELVVAAGLDLRTH